MQGHNYYFALCVVDLISNFRPFFRDLNRLDLESTNLGRFFVVVFLALICFLILHRRRGASKGKKEQLSLSRTLHNIPSQNKRGRTSVASSFQKLEQVKKRQNNDAEIYTIPANKKFLHTGPFDFVSPKNFTSGFL